MSSAPQLAITPFNSAAKFQQAIQKRLRHIKRRLENARQSWQEWRRRRNFLPLYQRFVLAAALLGVTLFIRLHTPLLTSKQEVYLLFIIPIFASAWFGGLSTGIFASLLAACLTRYFFISPLHSLAIVRTIDGVELATFFLEGVILSMMVSGLRCASFIAAERAEHMREDDERFRVLIEGVTDYAIYMVDPKGFILSWNDGAERITGYRVDEVIGHKSSLFHPPEDIALNQLERDLKVASDLGRHEGEGWRLRKDGTTFWANVITTALHDSNGNLRGFAKVIRDLTDQKQSEDTIRRQALSDILTGLPNRVSLQEHLEGYLRHAKRANEQIAVLFLDVDRFKSINDTLGHHTGDLLLKEIALRLRSVVRDEDLVARFGGDEFVIILRDLRSHLEAMRLADTFRAALRPAFMLQEKFFHLSSSVGVAMYPHDGVDAHTLLMNADSALYQAKQGGRDTVKLYTKTMNAHASERLSLENELRFATQREQLSLNYQPIFNLGSGAIIGAEALIRWNHPILGPIAPSEFIPLAEDSDIILEIGEWVFREVCGQLRQWKQDKIRQVPIAVNLSPRQFNQPQLIQFLEQQLQRAAIDPRLITIEITEGIAMQDIESSIAKLGAINRLGVQTAIDDFGIGFSSLNYMKRLPISKLKIDKSFVTHCSEDSRDAAIIRAIISMAKSLQLKVVAEGIEDTSQLNFLKSTRCDYGQGYLVSPPLLATDFAEKL